MRKVFFKHCGLNNLEFLIADEISMHVENEQEAWDEVDKLEEITKLRIYEFGVFYEAE